MENRRSEAPVLSAQLDATLQEVKAMSQLLGSLLQLFASLARVPLLGAQIGTLLLALPFLTAQVVTGLLAQIVGGMEKLVGAGAPEAGAEHARSAPRAAGDGSLGSFGVRRPAFLTEYERRQESAPAAAPEPAPQAG